MIEEMSSPYSVVQKSARAAAKEQHHGADTSAVNGSAAATDKAGRTILNVSSIAKWRGPAVGILRVEQALATHALARRSDIVLSIYDRATASFLAVSPTWAAHIVSWNGAIGRRHGRLRGLLPSPYSLVGVLERRRLASGSKAVVRRIAIAQQLILRLRRRRRRSIVPFRVAVGGPLILGPRDVIISAGSDWIQQDAAAIAELKQRCGFRLVVMCYDIIPLLLPQYFSPDDVAFFRQYWTAMFPLADRILVNSRCVERDIRRYCDRAAIRISETRLVTLGYDIISSPAEAPLPEALETGRFILFVSTIEPRKGHGLLLKAWRKLVAEGVPQRHRFKLVFVGRRGWQVDDILRQIDDRTAFQGTLSHFSGIGDDELAALYRAAAFCVYPSLYEGFGLPIIEAFSHRKAVIASNGGAVPETVGGLCPCLDPTDEAAWYHELKRWIEDPDTRARHEAKIRAEFSHPTWERAAAQIFDAVCRESSLEIAAAPRRSPAMGGK
jgi:glycosyltransferase involved in cell wall biosynthesis